MAPNRESSGRTVIGTIFSPAVALMYRLRYGAKFLLIGALLLVPLVALLYLQLRATTDSYEFSSKEVRGVDYIEPAKDLLLAVQRRRVLQVALLTGDTSVKNDLTAATADADARVSEVDVVEARLAGELRTGEKWGRVKAAWAKVRATAFTKPDEADAAHAELTTLLVDLILNDVGNNSNLILDPDLDSYWLMDAFVTKLPALGDIASSSATRALMPASDEASIEEKSIGLAGDVRVMTATSSDVVNVNMKTAFRETAKFGQSNTLQPRLEGPAKTASEAVGQYADMLRKGYLSGRGGGKDAKPEPAGPGGRQTVDAAVRVLGEVDALYDKIGPELRWLCAKRAARYATQRTFGIAAAGVAVFLLTYLFVGFFLAVRTSVRALALTTTRMIQGTTEAIALPSKDELGDIANDYNQINGALNEARTLRARVETENQELQENIMDLLQVVSDASDGDLRVRAKVTTGALGNVADAFNALMEALQKLLADVQGQVDKTNTGIDTIASAARRMAGEAASQAREIASARRVVEQMTSEIARVAENAGTAADASRRTEGSALEGAAEAQNVVAGMASLRANVQAGAKKMKNLGDRSMEITGIVGTITRISEQTNMLALNAAIEAARAGEHGRGFSVVAEEVRKLAERTAVATQEIDRLVKAIHGETNETVSAIEKQTEVVEKQSELVGRAGASLTRIQKLSTESAELVASISSIARSQVDGAKAIVETMAQVTSIAGSTQAGAESTVSTIADLTRLSEQLSQSMARFKIASAA